jgi:hypothetical protein
MTLDPGLTVLALRGLRHADEHYPFIDGYARRWQASFREILAACFPTLFSLVAGRSRPRAATR